MLKLFVSNIQNLQNSKFFGRQIKLVYSIADFKIFKKIFTYLKYDNQLHSCKFLFLDIVFHLYVFTDVSMTT